MPRPARSREAGARSGSARSRGTARRRYAGGTGRTGWDPSFATLGPVPPIAGVGPGRGRPAPAVLNRPAARLGIDPVKPITLLGVAALGEPDLLVEVEATAVIE